MDHPQTTGTLVMVEPRWFGPNPETAQSNVFQAELGSTDIAVVRSEAMREFESAVAKLRGAGVDVIVLPSPDDPRTTDAVFPNNWFSTHPDGRVYLYPMHASNRRLERQTEALASRLRESEFACSVCNELLEGELSGSALEGTGSIVFDHAHRKAYAAVSPRTDPGLFRGHCEALGYRPVLFEATAHGVAIYHTNVLMSVGQGFAVLCAECVSPHPDDPLAELRADGLELVLISSDQMDRFCGNVIQVASEKGSVILMSQTAHDAFTPAQRATLSTYGDLLPIEIPTIERYGGGSARCMVAEVFLPRGNS